MPGPRHFSHGWRPTAYKASNSTLIEPYGSNNLLPQEIMRTVYDSGTATACFRRLARFIMADGFADEVAGTTVLGESGITADALLQKIALSLSMHQAVALSVRFALGGKPGDVEVVPFETVRRLKKAEVNGPYKFVSNEGLGKQYQTRDDVFYQEWNPRLTPQEISRQVREQVKDKGYYNGHMVYLTDELPGQCIYPVPLFWSGKEDIETDAALSRFERKEVKTGFRPDALITVIGQDYSDVQNAETGEAEDSPKMQQVIGMVKDLKGSDSESTVGLLAAASKEEVPIIHQWDKKAGLQGLTDQTDRIARKVCRAWGIPPILIGLESGGKLGSTTEIKDTISLFQMDVVQMQSMVQRTMEQLFPGQDWTVSTLNPISFVPDWLIPLLAPDELATLKQRYL